MLLILLAQEDRHINLRPFDSERRIVELKPTVSFRMIEVVALVGEERVVFQYDEAVSEAARNIKLR